MDSSEITRPAPECIYSHQQVVSRDARGPYLSQGRVLDCSRSARKRRLVGVAMAIDSVWFVIGGYALAAIIVAVGLAYYFRR